MAAPTTNGRPSHERNRMSRRDTCATVSTKRMACQEETADAETTRARSGRRLVTLLGFVASAVFIVLAVRRLDLGAIAATWRSSHPLPWLPLGVAFYIAGHFVRGARCRVLVRPDATLALTTATNIVVTGYASNNVFPARLGELVRAGMLAERTGIPASQALVITLIERILDGVAILLLLIASAPRSGGWIHDLTWVGAAVFGIALLALFA